MKFAFLCKEPLYSVRKRIAVIGAGPAGLTVAGYFACRGYEVDVYDKLPYPGGLMTFAIPRHRVALEEVLDAWRDLENLGVKFYFKTKVSAGEGRDEGDDFVEKKIDLLELAKNYDGVVVATGTWRSRKLGVIGEDAKNVVTALEFLYKRRLRELKLSEESVEGAHKVVVVGAGLSAVDAAEECLSMGAREVHLVYRRTIKEAPAGAHKIRELASKGVKWVELVQPTKIVTEGDYARGIELMKVKLGEPDETGRPKPVPVPGTEHVIEADLVVLAVGEVPTPPMYSGYLLKHVDSSRRIVVESDYKIPGTNIFAVGDVVTGPSKIGLAVEHALKAVKSIDYVISGESVKVSDMLKKVEEKSGKPRLKLTEWRAGIAEEVCKHFSNYLGVKPDTCLSLAPFTRVFDYSKCIGCETCKAVCNFIHEGVSCVRIRTTEDGLVFPTACLHCANPKCQVVCKRRAIIRGELKEVLIDYKKCDRCLDCVDACPVKAIRMTAKDVVNCDLCLSLRKGGIEPACVSMCPSRAVVLIAR